MNQILITGEEKVKVKKQKKVVGINPIVIFYSIVTIIFGICLIASGIYVRKQVNDYAIAVAKPNVQITRNDDNNVVEIFVKHVRGIRTIEYQWNDEEWITLDEENTKDVKEEINLMGGTNTLKVKVTEENGQSVSYEKTFTAGNIPTIELEAVSNGVKINVTSEKNIDHITYSWDSGEKQNIQISGTENEGLEYEGIINAPNGKHMLEIEVYDITGNRGVRKQNVIGDSAPTVDVTAKRGEDSKVYFVIKVEDDEEVSTVEIKLNDGEKKVINVNELNYYTELEMASGENKLIVTAYNHNGLAATLRRKFVNN